MSRLNGELPTLVSLLFALDLNGEVLARLPVDLVTFRMIIDEVATITVLFLIEVRLGDGLVGKELVVGKLEGS